MTQAHQEPAPNNVPNVQQLEQKMVDIAITNLLIAEGIMQPYENGLSIKEQQSRVLDKGYEVIVRRHPDPNSVFDKISIRLMKVVRSSTVTLEAKKDNG